MEAGGQKAQDERVKTLWRTLDANGEDRLDLNGLKKGLRRMDHRMSSIERIISFANFFKHSRTQTSYYKI